MGPADLRGRRQALHLSQADLGRALGVARNTVARWERGELEIHHAEMVALAMDLLEGQQFGATGGLPRAGTQSNNLPAELSSFVGREEEHADLSRVLRTSRLLTLTGTGGVGKTRLAIRLASGVERDYPDGVWFVDLAPQTDPTVLARTVAAVVEVQEEPTRPLGVTLAAVLARRRSLLVLDNCEHLLEACAGFVASLLSTSPRLRIVATSREPLRVTAETVYRVLPLPTVNPSGVLEPEKLLQLASVRLLLERADAQAAGIAALDDAHALAEICWRLDGLPLALELAAARLVALGPRELASRLDDAVGLLSVGRLDAPARHHTLWAALDWSYALLSFAEQRLFARLAVFAGGWTLEACEGVAGGDGIEPSSVVDLLSRLVGKSLVVAEPGPAGVMRYRLLETVRQYAREQLDRSDELRAVCTRHREWFVAWIERAFPTGQRPLGVGGSAGPHRG
jgi:predicted ATPase/DNA-binding XRE family transcriptional regulator